ncbi:JAB domain-containing protein [Olivibacter sp. 47]|jgi:DNA repair protein RadC|uniref:JAB domain-containing protein n=1 Tax=Olivibacter sp. 47 TaxID=3056486 RepID=UPI0025A47997|nr:JAB domain-containing protein [Olivibacter sp. 47]MDM8175941.1 JAB domain-containing protein [Olivibacter sp. 47]
MKNQFIANELRLTYYKNESLNVSDFKKLNCSDTLSNAFRKIWNNNEIEIRESFYAIYLNTALNAVGYFKIADGGVDSVVVDLRLLITPALLSNAKFVAIAHNHPSGCLTPSQTDKIITEQVVKACGIMQMKLIDHIILCAEGYYSFSDNGGV